MTMLSQVASRLYWMARYLERAEDTARLTAAYHHLIMDIPRGSEPAWDVLIRILDAEEIFHARPRAANEQNVLKFLIADADYPCSIAATIRAARENVRTTRDVLPAEIWELVNELHIHTQEMAEKSVGRRNRQAFLEEVINRCQMINGAMFSTLCRDHAYRFIKLGSLLERCDMTTRIVDVGAGDIMGRDGAFAAIEPLLWGSLLRALSAIGTYRRMIGPTVEKGQVVQFVLKEPKLPRSVNFCLRKIREELKPLKHNEGALQLLDRARRKLARFDAENASREQVHAFIDSFQVLLSDIHQSIDHTWFRPESQ